MFRTGGSTGTGITSGLAPRQGYADPAGIVEQIQTRKSMIDAIAPRTPRRDNSMNQFLIDFGLNLVSGTPKSNIFATAAEQAKEPFAKFQQAKQLEAAYQQKEASEDRALVADMIKGMNDDQLSALMKDAKAAVQSGLYNDENAAIRALLKKKIYGVQDMPGEAKSDRIKDLELKLARDEEVPTGMLNSVAEHIWNIENDVYPKAVQEDLSRTRTFIKPTHIVGVKKDAEGEVSEIVLAAANDLNYTQGKIYFEAQTGDLFKKVSKEGEAPLFVRVDYETN